MTTKRDARGVLRAIEEQSAEDELNEILAMSDEELDRTINEGGGDARAIRASGEALAKELLESRKRNAWHGRAEDELEAFRKTAAASKSASKEKLPREELIRRIDVARKNPRFAAPVAMLFQKKTAEASTDAELEALLERIALLSKLEEE